MEMGELAPRLILTALCGIACSCAGSTPAPRIATAAASWLALFRIHFCHGYVVRFLVDVTGSFGPLHSGCVTDVARVRALIHHDESAITRARLNSIFGG